MQPQRVQLIYQKWHSLDTFPSSYLLLLQMLNTQLEQQLTKKKKSMLKRCLQLRVVSNLCITAPQKKACNFQTHSIT